jgi:hypothetical protein
VHAVLKRLPLAVLLVVMLASVSCSSPGSVGPVVGSGSVRTEDRPVQGFSRVELDGLGDLTVTQSGSESLKVEADDNVLPLVTSEVRGNTLVLGLKPGNYVRTTRLSFTVTAKQLDGVKINGSGNARMVDVATPALEVNISGSGNAQSAGRADASKIEISGSGKYDGAATASRTATVDISGSGDAVVQVSETLDVKVSGAGNVEYIGNPSVTKDISGAGDVRKRG